MESDFLLQIYTGHKRKVFAWEHMTEKKIYKNDGLGVLKETDD